MAQAAQSSGCTQLASLTEGWLDCMLWTPTGQLASRAACIFRGSL